MSRPHAASRRLAVVSVGLACALIAAGATRVARAQDTRDVKEPRLPAVCATLTARLSTVAGALSDAAEATLDTKRIQEAIDHCAAGGADAGAAPAARAVELRADGDKNVFLTAPLKLRAGVTLIVDAGVALFASRNPRDYDVTPGSCGTVADKRGHCQPLILAENAPGAGIMGDGAIDGRGGAVLLGAGNATKKPGGTWRATRRCATSTRRARA